MHIIIWYYDWHFHWYITPIKSHHYNKNANKSKEQKNRSICMSIEPIRLIYIVSHMRKAFPYAIHILQKQTTYAKKKWEFCANYSIWCLINSRESEMTTDLKWDFLVRVVVWYETGWSPESFMLFMNWSNVTRVKSILNALDYLMKSNRILSIT